MNPDTDIVKPRTFAPGDARVAIVDDHPLVREGLAMRISNQPDLAVVGDAATVEEGLELAKREQPDLMVVDISLKQGHGLDLIKRVKAILPKIKILVLSCHQDSLYAERSLRAGALGYLNKQESNERVIEAIRMVLAGKRSVSAEITQKLLDQAFDNPNAKNGSVECLSDRELEIFRMIGDGMTSGNIANRLIISIHTLDTHRENIKRKLGLRNANELTRAAVQWMIESR